LEDAGALWPFTPFAQDRLATELQTLRQSLDPLFDAHPHVLGVVLTSGELRYPSSDDASERHHQGIALRRVLPGNLTRESLIVHRRLGVPGQYAMVTQLCADEPEWLDQALHRLGVPGGAATLTTWPVHHGAPTADQRQSAHGLYLPGPR